MSHHFRYIFFIALNRHSTFCFPLCKMMFEYSYCSFVDLLPPTTVIMIFISITCCQARSVLFIIDSHSLCVSLAVVSKISLFIDKETLSAIGSFSCVSIQLFVCLLHGSFVVVFQGDYVRNPFLFFK